MMNTNFNSIEKSLNVETSIVKKDEKTELLIFLAPRVI